MQISVLNQRNKIVFIIKIALILLFISCTKTKKDYYPNGKLKAQYSLIDGVKEGVYKEFYPTGELKILSNYQNGLLNDKRKEFYRNGECKQLSYYTKNLKDGFEYYYGSNGKVDSLEESVLINPRYLNISTGNIDEVVKSFLDTLETPKIAILNRALYFDKNHNVILSKSHFFDMKFDKDTISMNDSIHVKIIFHHRYNNLPNLYRFIQVVKDPYELFDVFEASDKFLFFYEKPRKKGVNYIKGYITEGTPRRNDTITSVLFVRKKYYVR